MTNRPDTLTETQLTDEERLRVGVQVEHFIDILSRRYGIEPQEIVEAVRWVQRRQIASDKLKQSGIVSILGVVVAALALSIWEGIKALIWKH
jgi:hypothetical protein